MDISASQVKELREKTGIGFMECKKALVATEGNIDASIELLRKQGLDTAAKKAHRSMGEGIVYSYIHSNNKVGVMIELNCETDFVAKNEEFIAMAKDICMHAAAMSPSYLNREDVPEDVIAKEREIFKEQVKGKPDNIIEKIVDGKMDKFYVENCLLEQKFVKDDKLSIADLITALIAKIRENMQLVRFSRFEVGK